MLRAIFREGEEKTKPKMRAHEAVYKRTLTLNFPNIYGVSSGGAGGAGGTCSTKKGGGGKKTALEIVRGIRTVHTPALLLLILKYSYTAA